MRFKYLIVVFALLCGSAYAEEQAVQLSKDETRMVTAINKYREQHKLPALVADNKLEQAARARVPHYTHCYQGRWMWDEVKRYGFKGFATDNLCQGATSPEESVDGWIHSKVGHANQLRGQRELNGKWIEYGCNRIGVAHQGQNWIAVFGHIEEEKK